MRARKIRDQTVRGFAHGEGGIRSGQEDITCQCQLEPCSHRGTVYGSHGDRRHSALPQEGLLEARYGRGEIHVRQPCQLGERHLTGHALRREHPPIETG